jgi:hypothetical protein
MQITGLVKIDVPGFKLAVIPGKHNSPDVNIHWRCCCCKKWNYWDDACMCCADPAHVVDGKIYEDYAFHCDNCEKEGARIGEFINQLYYNAKDDWWNKIDELITEDKHEYHLYFEAKE